MKYCSNCGSAVTRGVSATDGRERYSCRICGSTHYRNPRVIVRCIVQLADTILMCQRANEPARGQWEVPSGYLECGESLEEGAARETYEETGVLLDPRRLALYSVVSLTTIEQVAISFHITLIDRPQIRCGCECLDVAFKAERDLAEDQVAWLSSAMAPAGRIFRGNSSMAAGVHELISGVCHGRATPMQHLARS
jgi:ADP-ribose pyrophosphatase YjhB (NUDIX family)